MKKILAMLALLSITSNATEVFSEYYVMEKVIPLLTNAESYTLNGEEVKAVKVDRKVLKALGTTDDPSTTLILIKKRKWLELEIIW